MKPKIAPARPLRLALAALSLGFATSSYGAPAIDGTDDGTEGYVTDTVQSQTPAWGNTNFLGNLRTVQAGNNLNVLLAGRTDGNSFLLFIDSKPGGINTISGTTITSGGEEGTINNLNGFTFEAGFTADYAVRVFGNAGGSFTNTYNLSTGVREYAGNALPGNISNTFIADARTVWTDNTGLATQVDGVELALDLGALGVPSGTQDVKLFAMLINGDSNYASNQMLASQDGAGTIDGGIVGYNLETEPGIQTVTVSVNAANPDNDNDGLLNSVETNNGPNSYNGPSDTGTDPNNPDTDGDYLEDGFEVDNNGGLGTDPTLADSDSDGANDGTEYSLGTDIGAGPIPSGGATAQIGFDFFDYAEGGFNGATGFETRVFDFDNSTSNDAFLGHTGAVAPWTTSFGSEIVCGKLLTENGNAIRQFNGPATGGSALGRVENVTGVDAKQVYVKIDLTRLTGSTFSGVSFVNGTTEVAFAGVRGALNGADRNFGVEITGEAGAAFTGDIPVDRIPNTIVARLDTTGAGTIAIWVDPDTSTASAPTPDAEASFVTAANAVATGIRLASGGRAYWDDLAVTTTWDELDAITPTDADTDTLRDSWEELFAPGNLATLAAAGQDDGDTLDNAGEQALGTNPLDEDTDNDGLLDNVETNTGTFVSSSNTGTDPCDADTDDDNLQDNVETGSGTYTNPSNTGTNPNLADTDDDGENDGYEVFQNTDPTDNTKSSFLLGLVQINGIKDALYGDHVAVQTVNTDFGDNFNELNAAYGRVQDGKLYLMLTGNLEDNFNKLEIFIDSKSGGQSSYAAVVDDLTLEAVDGTDSLNSMFFEAGFTADYHIICRRGLGSFDIDVIDLQAGTYDSYQGVLSEGTSGYGSTGTGVNASPIRVGYNGSNSGGVVAGTTAAVEADALAVTTGIELCIDLTDLGSPTTEIEVMAMINNQNHDFLSNQVLAGLPAPATNLGDPGVVDFEFGVAGDQSFTVSVVEPSGDLVIDSVTLVGGGTQLQIEVSGLTNGSNYVLKESTTLSSFGAVTTTVTPGASFTASGSTQTLVINLPAGDRAFYRVEDAP